MPELYDSPEYYEIAFSFRDIPAEVDLFEECFKRFSQDVETVPIWKNSLKGDTITAGWT